MQSLNDLQINDANLQKIGELLLKIEKDIQTAQIKKETYVQQLQELEPKKLEIEKYVLENYETDIEKLPDLYQEKLQILNEKVQELEQEIQKEKSAIIN